MAFLVLLALLAGLIAFLVYANRRRLRALSRLANERAWSFEPGDAPDLADRYAGLALFGQGAEGMASDVMRLEADGRSVEVFGYRYGWRGYRRSVFVHQTVVHVHDARMALPAFSMRGPETVHYALERRGLGNVFLHHAPAFSDRNYVEADDPAATAGRFTPAVLSVLGSRDKVSIDGSGPHLLYFRRNEVVKVADLPARVDEALELADAFASFPAAGQPPPLA